MMTTSCEATNPNLRRAHQPQMPSLASPALPRPVRIRTEQVEASRMHSTRQIRQVSRPRGMGGMLFPEWGARCDDHR